VCGCRFAAASIVLAAAPAWAAPRPASLYPLAGTELTPAGFPNLQTVLLEALGHAEPGAPFVANAGGLLQESCGPATTADAGCLAGSADEGVVLLGTLMPTSDRTFLALWAVDADAERYGPAFWALDRRRPIAESAAGLLRLLAREIRAGRVSAAMPAAPARSLAPAPAAQALPAAALASRAPEPPRSRLKTVGLGLAGAGLVLAAAGGVFAFLASSLNEDLTTRYGNHTLTADDLGSYDALTLYDNVSLSLFSAGALFGVAGGALWGIGLVSQPGGAAAGAVRPESRGAVVAYGGRF